MNERKIFTALLEATSHGGIFVSKHANNNASSAEAMKISIELLRLASLSYDESNITTKFLRCKNNYLRTDGSFDDGSDPKHLCQRKYNENEIDAFLGSINGFKMINASLGLIENDKK